MALQTHVDLKNPYYIRWTRFLRESDNWSEDQINDYQFSELKRVISAAYENTVGYRNLFNNNHISPFDIKSFSDIRKIPFIEKESIRDNLNDYTIKTYHPKYVTTGGSTGIPTGIYITDEAFAKELASKAHQYYRVGWNENGKQFVLRGSSIDSKDHIQFIPEYNEMRCSSYYLTDKWMEIFLEKAREYKPDWLRCYPSAGYQFARFLQKHNKIFPQIKGILCASENLYQYQNDLLKEQFNCRVFSHYGHYEMAVLAGYCEFTDDYHVLPQYGYAELLDKNNQLITTPGEIGQIVGTSFINNATQFIRYRTYDYAAFKSWACPQCKRPYQIWDRIEGRAQEFIITKSGRYVSMTAMNMHDNIFDCLKEFQFYQDKQGKLDFNYISESMLPAKVINNIQSRLLIKLDDDVDLCMNQVDEIKKSKRGKHTFLVQKLNINF